MAEERLGVVGIVIEDSLKAGDINHILSQYGEIIIGRMGVPRVSHKERGVSVISLIVHGTNDEIGAMTGRLGNVKGVQVKSALSSR
ncbi:TM1266 family iron-only hydrogenase system putative regulator [Azotosporobacter soli]|jgi:putative iron-only hydrogenase system regulator|uniref:TM1266 family iron-only hydrogenase system putative regulator n=1 Tax=Azotosporobacter soli TaxID=3055040 RepID=UPI0031FE685E